MILINGILRKNSGVPELLIFSRTEMILKLLIFIAFLSKLSKFVAYFLKHQKVSTGVA